MDLDGDVTLTVVDDPKEQRFELWAGDRLVGFLDYHRNGEALDLDHAEVDPSERGQGLGAVLVGGALDQLAEQGVAVRPRCSYVARYMAEHLEYSSMIAG